LADARRFACGEPGARERARRVRRCGPGKRTDSRDRHRASARPYWWRWRPKALDDVRRAVWNDMRDLDDQAAKKFKDARWSLMKNPDSLTDRQAVTLRRLKRRGGDLWRAYRLKESCRAIFAGDLDSDEVEELVDRLMSQGQRSRLKPFVKHAKTLRENRDGILAAIRLGVNNGRAEGLNNVVRLIARRAYGFHSAAAAIALVMLCCGPISLRLPYEGLLWDPASAVGNRGP
jgi:transposase